MHASLRDPGGILLISCYELGHQPLALASPLALLRRAGYDPASIDLAREPLREEPAARAAFIGISVPMHTAMRVGAQAARRLRELNPQAVFCFYGLYATLNAGALLDGPADAVIGGEFEEPLLRLIGRLETAGGGDASLAGVRGGPLAGLAVPGVRTRQHDASPWLEKIRFAVPERESLPPPERYARLEHLGESRLAGYVEASRGCLHLCRHCPIPPVYGGRFFVVPRPTVLADVRAQVGAGVRHITFGDADFLNGPGHSLALARAVHAEFPDLTFDITAKIEHLLAHRDLLPELSRLGCLFIVSAAESLNDASLAILGKGHTRADLETALRLTRDAGISLRPSFVPFMPWTDLDDYRDLLDFIDGESLVDQVDPVQLSIRLLVPPGSLLLEHPAMRPHLGAYDPERFTYLWTHPDARMDLLQREVAGVVEGSARGSADDLTTFRDIRRLAKAAAGGPVSADGDASDKPASGRRGAHRPPRLSEPWFCCAEPTESQMEPVRVIASALPAVFEGSVCCDSPSAPSTVSANACGRNAAKRGEAR